MDITIIEKNGWEKVVNVEKAVTRVGSASSCDIKLASPNISPVHLQIIYDRQNPGSCKVLNFGPAFVLSSHGAETTVESYATQEARDGDVISIAEYRLRFQMPLTTGLLASSLQISATLQIKDPVLRLEAPTVATLRLKNLGNNPNCLLQVSISGLAAEHYQLDPLPILYPGAEEDVRIRFFHRQESPPAGFLTITLLVTAPASYPGEQVIIQQGLYVTPVLKTALRLEDDMPVTETAPAVELPAAPAGLEEAKPQAAATFEPFPTPEPSPALAPNPQPEKEKPQPAAAQPARPVKDLSSAKVVRNPSETYWDE